MSDGDKNIEQAMVALMPRLRRFAYGLSGSLDQADDLVQATYARALSRLHQWQPGTRLDSWLYRIAQSIHSNRLKADNVRQRYYDPRDPDTQSGNNGAKQIEAQLTLLAVRDFIQQLPKEQRVVLLLVCVEGLSYKETAETLDLPIGTVTSRLARARLAVNSYVQQTKSNPLKQTGSD